MRVKVKLIKSLRIAAETYQPNTEQTFPYLIAKQLIKLGAATEIDPLPPSTGCNCKK